jgi:hypothetical protein
MQRSRIPLEGLASLSTINGAITPRHDVFVDWSPLPLLIHRGWKPLPQEKSASAWNQLPTKSARRRRQGGL